MSKCEVCCGCEGSPAGGHTGGPGQQEGGSCGRRRGMLAQPRVIRAPGPQCQPALPPSLTALPPRLLPQSPEVGPHSGLPRWNGGQLNWAAVPSFSRLWNRALRGQTRVSARGSLSPCQRELLVLVPDTQQATQAAGRISIFRQHKLSGPGMDPLREWTTPHLKAWHRGWCSGAPRNPDAGHTLHLRDAEHCETSALC